jgi:hypothetical protein
MTDFYTYARCNSIRIFEYVPYRNEVLRYLDLINTTFVGKTLYAFLLKRLRRVSIIPYRPAQINSSTSPETPEGLIGGTDPGSSVSVPVTFFGVPIMMVTVPGSGGGANSIVRYNPATWRQMEVNFKRTLPGAGPGEMLFHELIHSMQASHGKTRFDPVPENTDMESFNEFCAVAAANVYRSERGFRELRSNHLDFEGERTDSDEYYEFYKAPIQKWFGLQREFCIELARSPARFNPFRSAADDLGIAVPPIPTPMALPAKTS